MQASVDDKLLHAQRCSDNKTPEHQRLEPAQEIPREVTSAVAIVTATEEVDVTPTLSGGSTILRESVRRQQAFCQPDRGPDYSTRRKGATEQKTSHLERVPGSNCALRELA